ncbi:MAG: primosomal protein N', partial [Thermoplasmata archaeon]|nr:primosomal protein N' [Thermoplasmata archaeon]
VGLGDRSREDIARALEAHDVPGTASPVFPPLPAGGLLLVDVRYDMDFHPLRGDGMRRMERKLRALELELRVSKELLGCPSQ